jgi:hypothetical protein
MFYIRYLHGGWAVLRTFIVVSIGCVDLGHFLMEGRFLLRHHFLVSQLNVPLLLRLKLPTRGIPNVDLSCS